MANLTPQISHLQTSKWKQGHSGNPKGKPKGAIHIKTLTTNILNSLDTWNKLPDSTKELRKLIGSNKTFAEALIYSWAIKALDDPRFANIIIELVDGKGKNSTITNVTNPMPILGGFTKVIAGERELFSI